MGTRDSHYGMSITPYIISKLVTNNNNIGYNSIFNALSNSGTFNSLNLIIIE